MIRVLFFTCLLSFSIQAQETVTRELDSILNRDQAEMYLTENPSKGSKIVVSNEEKHKTLLAKELFDRGRSTSESDFKITHFKVIETNSVLHYRVSYIFLDGKKLSEAEISAAQNQIMSKYVNGVPFNKLAKQYSMDFSARQGGDSGWVSQGKMNPKFEDMAINTPRAIGDLFTIDINDEQKYYVVLKTHDIKYIKEVTAIKIVEKKS